MKELTFKKAVRAELEIMIAVYTMLFTLGEATHSKTFMEIIEDVIECWLDPEALSYFVVSYAVIVAATLVVDLLRGFFIWLSIQKFNRRR